MIKEVIFVVVSLSTHHVVTNGIKAILPSATKIIPKIMSTVGTIAIASFVSGRVVEHTEQIMDLISNELKKQKKEIKEIKELDKENI